MKNVGAVLKGARQRAGLSQHAVARRLGIATSQVSQVESGRRADPQFSTVARMAAIVNISLDEIAAQYGLAEYVERPRKSTAKASGATRAASLLLSVQRNAATLSKKVERAVSLLHEDPELPRQPKR